MVFPYRSSSIIIKLSANAQTTTLVAAVSGERTRPACWRARLAIADFALTPALQEMLNVLKDCFGAKPKPARGTRALPRHCALAPDRDSSIVGAGNERAINH